MAEGLPEGLVVTNQAVTRNIQTVDRIDVEDIRKLWQVFSANRAILAENVGRRLENFFWRIWSSHRVLGRLSGAQVARQFDRINQGGYIRTTPTQSPRTSRNFGETRSQTSGGTGSTSAPTTATVPFSRDYNEEDRSTPTPADPLGHIPPFASAIADPSSSLAEVDRSSSDSIYGGDSDTPAESAPRTRKPILGSKERRTETDRPPPILKNFSSGSRSALTSSPEVHEPGLSRPPLEREESVPADEAASSSGATLPRRASPPRRYTSTRFSEEVAVSTPRTSVSGSKPADRSARVQVGGSQRGGKSHPVVYASTGASKRRPAIVRHRSSESSHDSSKAKTSLSPSSPGLGRRTGPSIKGSSDTAVQDTDRSVEGPRAARPHPSREQRAIPEQEASSEDDSGYSDEDETGRPAQNAPLVEPDFRSRFAEQKGSQYRSFTNLPSLAQKSKTVTPAAASFQASGTLAFAQASSSGKGKGKAREAFTDEIVPLKAPAPGSPVPEEEETAEPLSRTKSQLTLLLQRSKASSEDRAPKESKHP